MGKWVHRLAELDVPNRTGLCINCGVVKVKRVNNRYACIISIEENRRRRKTWPSTTPSGNRNVKDHSIREAWIKEAKIKQAGKCAICDTIPARFHLDHDHATGKWRSLLCHNCNVGLGFFADDPIRLASAIEYLNKHS